VSHDYSADVAKASAFAEEMGFTFYIVWGHVSTIAGEHREATGSTSLAPRRLGGPLLRNDT